MATKKSKKKRPLKTAKKTKPSSKKKAPTKKKSVTKKSKKSSLQKSKGSKAKKKSTVSPKKKSAARKSKDLKVTTKKSAAKKKVKKAPKKLAVKKTAGTRKKTKPTISSGRTAAKRRLGQAKKIRTGSVKWQDVFSPLEDRVLVEEIVEETETASGLWIPQAPKDYREGVVASVGPGAKDASGRRRAMDIVVGDRVMLGKYTGQSLRLMDQPFLIVRESELIGIVE